MKIISYPDGRRTLMFRTRIMHGFHGDSYEPEFNDTRKAFQKDDIWGATFAYRDSLQASGYKRKNIQAKLSKYEAEIAEMRKSDEYKNAILYVSEDNFHVRPLAEKEIQKLSSRILFK